MPALDGNRSRDVCGDWMLGGRFAICVQHKRIRPILQWLGWTKGLPLRALALTKRILKRLLLATESCGMLAGEQQHLVEYGFVQWVLSKVRQNHCSHTALVLQQSCRGEAFGATKYENC